jgi:AP-1 complex subunit beta-1
LEFKEYATKVDVEFVRKSVRAIGRAAIKVLFLFSSFSL